MAAKPIEPLLAHALDARRKREAEQRGEAEHRLDIAVHVGRVDVALDDIMGHEAVDDRGAFAVGGADHEPMPEKMRLIKGFEDHQLGALGLGVNIIILWNTI